MIVPFLFTFDEYSKEKPTHQWVAYKFLDFCFNNKFPIVIQHKYLEKHNGHSSLKEEVQETYKYKILNKEQVDSIDKYIITEDEEKQIKSKYKNLDDTYISLLKENDDNLERIIEKKIKEIKKNNKEEIEAIITWIYYPSLEKVCKKYNIPVINYELSTIRRGIYRTTLGYFKFGNKYENKEEFKKIKEFDEEKNFLFNNKELINLLIEDSRIDYINYVDSIKEYDIGVTLGLKKDFFHIAFDGNEYKYILDQISKFTPSKKILVRSHPASSPFTVPKKYTIDSSSNSIEFITKCKNIVCSISNVGYESILFGTGIISTNDCMITSFGKKKNLYYNDAHLFGMKELNFLTFYYYVPYELMFNAKYIRYRLKEKNVNKIFNYNMNYILKEYNLSLKEFKNMNLEDRFKKILNTHNISSDKKNSLLEAYSRTNLSIEKINLLERQLKEAHQEIENMINSKSWKITKPLRDLTLKIKKIGACMRR